MRPLPSLHRPWLWLLLALVACGPVARATVVNGDSPHGALTLECGACHSTEGWRTMRAAPDFNHAATAFPLQGRHSAVACRACHPTLVFRDAGTQCVDCHLDIHRGQFANACRECHTPAGWANEPEMLRRHQQTRFPLTGVHADVECQACHAGGQFTGLSIECVGCHQQVLQATNNPDHAAAGFSKQCTHCHDATRADWKGARYDHTQTGFALAGGHARANCNDCHSVRFAGTSAACFACHEADYTQASDPNHAASAFDHNCALCHTAVSWENASFDHNLARFPLTGAHITAECALCHTDGHFTGTVSECDGCHSAAFDASTNPNHAAGNFPRACANCHTTSGWSPASFDHNLSTFVLTGAHITVACADCHLAGQFTGTPADCWSCHEAGFNGTTDPNHVASQFSHACTDCHTTTAWQPASFDHSATAFPLTGAHLPLTCAQCHVNNVFAGTPTACFACHEADFTATTAPNHPAAQFPHTCETCHTTTAWQPSSFNHAATAFPLTGAHGTVACNQCHANGVYAGTPTACFACHQSDFEGVTDPNHVTAQFDHNCTVCHTTQAWQPASFDHAATAFPLTGAHTSAACAQCHVNGQYHGTPTDCYACHQNDFTGADDPNHVTAQFPHTCLTCHTTAAWEPSSFNHAATAFPLTGAHTSTACAQCHVNGVYAGTPTACYACHQSDFEGVSDPNHVTGQFDHNCTVCHSTTAWDPASFNHASTAFPLTGAHTSTACAQCHVNGQFSGTPTDCWACHQNDFNGATDPNHTAAGFPHSCADCHATTNWDADFNHDGPWFPIYSGRHQGEWDQCSDCHTNPNDFAVFSCITCHEHNQADMDDEHDEVGNYVYQSSACYTCHPRGIADDRAPRPSRGNAR